MEGESPIDVYIDVNGQWVSGKKDSKIKWTHLEIPIDKEKYSQTWRVGKADEELFAEHRDRGEWGTLYFSGPQVCMMRTLMMMCFNIVNRMHTLKLAVRRSYVKGLPHMEY